MIIKIHAAIIACNTLVCVLFFFSFEKSKVFGHFVLYLRISSSTGANPFALLDFSKESLKIMQSRSSWELYLYY